MRKSIFILVYLFVCLSFIPSSYAGGPLSISNGMALKYEGQIIYRFDRGSLGKFSNSEAVSLIEDLLKDIEGAEASSIDFKRDNPEFLTSDINSTNFEPILNTEELLGFSPIIFDNDGLIFDALNGQGASNFILGVAGPVTEPTSTMIEESIAIFNGKFINGINNSSDRESDTSTFKGTIIHEFGHFIGLDHSQINVEAVEPGASEEIINSVPLMFPVAVNSLFQEKRDDKSALALLYPDSEELKKLGSIEGKIFREDGLTPVLGANIIARKVDNPLNEAVSSISDFLEEGNGRFTLFALPPGDYTLEIEPVHSSFTSGSGVGPYTKSSTDLSFQNPVPKGFFTGANKPITSDKSQALIVMVVAGQKLTDQNIIASTQISSNPSGTTINESEPNDTLLEAQAISIPTTINGAAASTDDGQFELSSDLDQTVTISDLFKFNVITTSNVSAFLDIKSENGSDDLDLVLLSDEENPEVLDSSSQTGNENELINKTLPPGSYLLGVGAFSGSSDYILQISSSTQQGGTPFVKITGRDILVLNRSGKHARIKFTLNAFNFSARSNCLIKSTGDALVKIRPSKLALSSQSSTKKFTVSVPRSEAVGIINENQSSNVLIEAECSNGAIDSLNLTITPTLDNLGTRIYDYLIRKN